MSEEEKSTLTLQGGRVIDCGKKEKEELSNSLKEKNPKKIACSTVKLLVSSKDLMGELSNATIMITYMFKKDELISFNEFKKMNAEEKASLFYTWKHGIGSVIQ